MRRRVFPGILLVCVVFLTFALLAGCGSGKRTTTPAVPDEQDTVWVEEAPEPLEDFAGAAVDVDLTGLSSTMVYAEVFNMMANPDDYIGKTIRARGNYSPEYFDGTDKYYHYVTIDDAAACCQQGLEFVVGDGERVYPDEYPQEMSEIEVVGVYGIYYELGGPVYYLAVDDIVVV